MQALSGIKKGFERSKDKWSVYFIDYQSLSPGWEIIFLHHFFSNNCRLASLSIRNVLGLSPISPQSFPKDWSDKEIEKSSRLVGIPQVLEFLFLFLIFLSNTTTQQLGTVVSEDWSGQIRMSETQFFLARVELVKTTNVTEWSYIEI